MIGARQEVRTALGTASEELQRGAGDSFLDDLDLEQGFDQTYLTQVSGTSFINLGDGEQGEVHAMTALQLFSEMPEKDRWIHFELGTRVDLATARILCGELAGTEEALAPVFAVPPVLRTESVARKLGNLGRRLAFSRYQNAPETGRIGEAIEGFTARRIPLSAAG